MTPSPLTWLHIGDLHLKHADAPNRADFQAIIAAVAALPPGSLDFVLLPGDNADNGTPEQYAWVREGLAPLQLPVHILPGDHDMEPGSLHNFQTALHTPALPYCTVVADHRCLFLDVVSAGTGGPDFRLGTAQLDWADNQIEAAAAAGQTAALFMHTYPADLREGADRIGALLARPHVACVSMGHTHYNELANDGGTIFMATRSTGQVEEGPVGFSVAAIDGPNVSWRFKPLASAWPFVLITTPVDVRLLTHAVEPGTTVRAKVLCDTPLARVELRADDGEWQRMEQNGPVWQATLAEPARQIIVRATDMAGRTDQDRITPAPADFEAPDIEADGSDQHSIGAWPRKGIPGGQLGPNRNGRKW